MSTNLTDVNNLTLSLEDLGDSENLVLGQLKISWIIFVFILIIKLFDIVLML